MGKLYLTQVSRYQKGKTNLDFTEARDSEWQWHQLEHMQVCTSLQTDNHANTPPTRWRRRPASIDKERNYVIVTQWCIAKKWRWVYAKGRGEGPEGTLLIYDH